MRLRVISLLSGGASGSIEIDVDPSTEVNSLIAEFCIQKGCIVKSSYVIRNAAYQILECDRTVGSYNLGDDDVVYLGKQVMQDDKTFGCSNWWILTAVSFLIGAGGLVAISVIYANSQKLESDYGIVIDAGSTHTKLFVYKWDPHKNSGTAVVREAGSFQHDAGISTYDKNPDAAGKAVEGLLNEAQQIVPEDHQATTPLYLGATAGMRLLRLSDPQASDAIMSAVQTAMQNSVFDYKNASIISGEKEGSFSWVTVNYLDGDLNEPVLVARKPTVGALDMGGASTQITFEPSSGTVIPANYSADLLLYGESYTVYTHSYLCYGKMEAENRFKAELVVASDFSTIVPNPCAPEGNSTYSTSAELFRKPCVGDKEGATAWGSLLSLPRHAENKTYEFQGTSDYMACQLKLQTLLVANCTDCPFQPVSAQPLLHGDFLAFASYYYVMAFLNLTSTESSGVVPRGDFLNATLSYCRKTWTEVSQIPMPPGQQSFLPLYCFDAVYIDFVLSQGYGFDDSTWETLKFIQSINKAELGWTLGFMINATTSFPDAEPIASISTAVFVILCILFVIFIFISFGFAVWARKSSSAKGDYQRLSQYGAL